MPKAVRYDEYGGVDVLYVSEVPRPVPGRGQVLVAVKAAGINPGESMIRSGVLATVYPLAEVRAAYTELERRHTRGKIVLVP